MQLADKFALNVVFIIVLPINPLLLTLSSFCDQSHVFFRLTAIDCFFVIFDLFNEF
jgi:hypothetical protein